MLWIGVAHTSYATRYDMPVVVLT
eukprot:COSAG02_NODE_1837_length_10712_cov_4.781306_1_plen_23_part_10